MNTLPYQMFMEIDRVKKRNVMDVINLKDGL